MESLKHVGVGMTGAQEEAAREMVGKKLMGCNVPVVVPLVPLVPLVPVVVPVVSKKRAAEEDAAEEPLAKKAAVVAGKKAGAKGPQCSARVVLQGEHEMTGAAGDPNIGKQCSRLCHQEGVPTCTAHTKGSKYGDYLGSSFNAETTELAMKYLLPKMVSEEEKAVLLAKCDGPTKEKMQAEAAKKAAKKAAGGEKPAALATKKPVVVAEPVVSLSSSSLEYGSDEDGGVEDKFAFEEAKAQTKVKPKAVSVSVPMPMPVVGGVEVVEEEGFDVDFLVAAANEEEEVLRAAAVSSRSRSRSSSPMFMDDMEDEVVEEGKPVGFLKIGEEDKKVIVVQKVSYYADKRLKTINDKLVPIDLYDSGTGRYAGTFNRGKATWMVKM